MTNKYLKTSLLLFGGVASFIFSWKTNMKHIEESNRIRMEYDEYIDEP